MQAVQRGATFFTLNPLGASCLPCCTAHPSPSSLSLSLSPPHSITHSCTIASSQSTSKKHTYKPCASPVARWLEQNKSITDRNAPIACVLPPNPSPRTTHSLLPLILYFTPFKSVCSPYQKPAGSPRSFHHAVSTSLPFCKSLARRNQKLKPLAVTSPPINSPSVSLFPLFALSKIC